MARGRGQDKRETFVRDSLRLRNKGSDQNGSVINLTAPQKNSIELYFKNKILYKMEANGVETPIGGFGSSASPGFTWGFHGQAVTGKWLFNDEVPSSATGRVMQFARPTVRKILTNCVSSTVDCRLELVVHDGNATNIQQVSVIVLNGVTEKVQDVSIPLVSGKQLAVRVIQGSCENPVVGVLLDGLY